MNSISCTSLCVAAILLQCLLYVEAKPSIKAKKMKAFDLRKFKTFKKISIKPFPALQTRSSNGIHPNHISLNKLDGLKSSSDRLVSANHFVSNKTALKHSDKQKDQVKNYESNVAISSGNESGDNDLENENESGDNDFENENENLKKSTKNLVENYSEPKNVFLNNFYNAVENSKTKGKNEITNIIETKFLQPRALPTTYNTNLTIENSVHSYATFKSNIHLKPSSSIQQRGILSNVLKNANFSIQNSVHTYTVKKSNSKPNKKEELVRLDPVDVVGVKRDNDPIEKRNNYPVERERNFMLKGKSPSDVAAEIEMNDKALIPLLSNASPKELRIDSETPNEETQGHISRGKYGLPFEGSHESNYGKRDSRRHDGNHEDHKNIQLYKMRNGYELTPHSGANYVRKTMADFLRSRTPYQVNLLLSGCDDEGRPALYHMDYLGAMVKVPFGSHGYGSFFSLSTLDRHWRSGMSRNEVMDLMKNVIAQVQKRFIVNLPSFSIRIVDKDGIHDMGSYVPDKISV